MAKVVRTYTIAVSPPTVNHQEDTMFARMIQLVAKQGRGKELQKTMNERALQALQEQPGFVEGISLVPETEQDQYVGISIWKSKSDADRFAQGPGQQLLQSYRPLLEAEPTIRSFQVDSSTIHDASSRAASR
jgi:heme-degrading monooxygenase HmoA